MFRLSSASFTLLLLLVLFAGCEKKAFDNKWTTLSPDSVISIQCINNRGHLEFAVFNKKDTVVKLSTLGIKANGIDFTNNLEVERNTTRNVKESYSMVSGKRLNNITEANETILTLKNTGGVRLELIFRAYNDGVAFRYGLSEENGKTLVVTSEETHFAIPTNGKAWLQNYGLAGPYTPAYEDWYSDGSPIGEDAKDSSGWSFPALFKSNDNWILISESNLTDRYFGSHLKQNCVNGIYKIANPEITDGNGHGDNFAHATASLFSPWRVIITGKSPAVVMESNLINDLALPSVIKDVSWIKAGRSSWSWWGNHSSSKNYEQLKKFVDLSADMRWEYSLVDANWDVMEGGSIEELAAYAKKKGVGLTLWYNSGGDHNIVSERPRNILNDSIKRKAEFRKLNAWGIKGIKVDFFQSDKQDMIKLYLAILKDAAAEKLLVDFHGCTIPRGWSRTYPNLMSMEAIRGAEQYGWDSAFAQRAPSHNIIEMFTRNVIGPADYTPVTFSSYECCPHQTTNTHELALSVLFESGILHVADREESIRKLNENVGKFLSIVAVEWDNRKYVSGEPSKDIILARQKGTDWFIAGANGEKRQKDFALKFPFIGKGSYKLTLFTDGLVPQEIKVTVSDFDSNNTIQIKLNSNGGFVAWLAKQTN